MSLYREVETLLTGVANQVQPTVNANTRYEPTIGTAWCRTTFLPGRSTTMSLGVDHYSEYTGLFRIDVFVDRGAGTDEGNIIVDKFIQAYKNKPMIEPEDHNIYASDVNLYVGEVWREAAVYEQVWVGIPVFVSWRCIKQHIQNT